MSYINLTESSEKMKQQTTRRKTSPASDTSFQAGYPSIAQLQRAMGNRNVAKLIQTRQLTPEGKITGLQRKLTVGAADDQYEQEADRVARQVMNIPDAAVSNAMQRDMSPEEDKDKMLQTKPLAASITPFVQREMVNNEEPEDKERDVQAKFLTKTGTDSLQRPPEEDDKDKMLQTKPLAASIAPFVQREMVNNEEPEDKEKSIQAISAGSMSGSFEAGGDVETKVSQSKGHGSPLPDPVRAFMEPRFGVDFSHVRVHAGSDARQMNRNVGAQAFTHGSDIYFGEGRGPSNFELTAHELTHVVQQTGGMPLRKKVVDKTFSPERGGTLRRICANCRTDEEEKNKGSSISLSVQRTIGDGHDLMSPRFSGDPVLEACFDNERLLRIGSRGSAVSKLQQALMDAGIPLPKFGADGIFGSETDTAVRNFQKASGISIDGLVGPDTMGALDTRFSGPAPTPPIPTPPTPTPPAPAPARTLKTDLQALINARNTAYADYKAKITAATPAERAAVLSDTAFLRSLQGVLAENDFAKTVELLGRSAPTAGTMLADTTVSAAMTAAFTASSPAVTLPPHNPANPVGPCNPPAGTPPPAGVHEEGGWIYMNLITGALDTRRAAGGGQANIGLGGPPNVADSIVVGTFHTHPNVGPCWGAVFPSGTDTNSANNTGVPWLIIGAFPDVATTQTASTGPGQRLHLAGNRGFPGATGGDAPQATIDGSFDEV